MTLGLRPRHDGLERYGLVNKTDRKISLLPSKTGCKSKHGINYATKASMKKNITMGPRFKRATLALFSVLVVISPQAAIVTKLVIGAITGAANAMTNPNP